MKRIKKVFLYFTELLKQRLRTFKAIWQYPEVHISTGVVVGPGCTFGEDVKLYKHVLIANASVDDFSYIGGNSEIKNCSIGKFCSIAPDVKIGLGIHPIDKISTYPGFYSKQASGAVAIGHDPSIVEKKKVNIGHDVWIGTNSLIMDGVSIGNGAVIAAGSIVTKDVKPYAIVGGIPAKTIRFRFNEEQISLLENFKWWNYDLDFCRKNASLFLKPEELFKYIKDGNENG